VSRTCETVVRLISEYRQVGELIFWIEQIFHSFLLLLNAFTFIPSCELAGGSTHALVMEQVGVEEVPPILKVIMIRPFTRSH